MTTFIDETEPFRVFRLTNFQAQSATDGELLGALLRAIVEMLTRDQSGAVVEHLRHQADLAEAMLPPRAERPAPKPYSWRRYIHRLDPVDDEQHKRSPDRTIDVDKALNTDEVLDDAPPQDDDDPPIERRDRKLQEARIRDALDDEFEKNDAYRREAERFEAEMIALADGGDE